MQHQYRVVWPPVTTGIKVLGAILVALWILPIFLSDLRALIDQHGVLTPSSLVSVPWTILTHGFFERDFLSVFFSILALWLFGGELEARWGRRKWWIVQVVALVLGGLVIGGFMAIMGQGVFSGWKTPIMALVGAYCIRQWDAPLNFFFIPMTGKSMLAFFVGLSAVMVVISGQYWLLGSDLVGVLVGWGATRSGGPKGGLGAMIRDLRTRWRLQQARRRLKVVDGGKSNGKHNPDRPDRKHFN
jgi:membrane associated rhomboid family serine protease